MKVKEIYDHFKDHPKPIIAAAAAIGVYPSTIKAWEKKGVVPKQWAHMIKDVLKIDLGKDDYEPGNDAEKTKSN